MTIDAYIDQVKTDLRNFFFPLYVWVLNDVSGDSVYNCWVEQPLMILWHLHIKKITDPPHHTFPQIRAPKQHINENKELCDDLYILDFEYILKIES